MDTKTRLFPREQLRRKIIDGYFSKTKKSEFELYIKESFGEKIEVARHNSNKCNFMVFSDKEQLSLDLIQHYLSGKFFVLTKALLIGGNSEDGYNPLKLSEFNENVFSSCEKFLNQIQSNFVGAILNLENNPTMYLFSHRAGPGRIYYYLFEDGIAFCSDFRVLLGFNKGEINYSTIYAILKYGAAPEPLTISKNIHSVPVNHYLVYSLKNQDELVKPYFKFKFSEKRTDPETALCSTKKILKGYAQVLARLNSSVLLSGGVDSTLFACLMKDAYSVRDLKSFYCSFDKDDREIKYAHKASEVCSFPLYSFDLTEIDDIIAYAKKASSSYSHPFSDIATIPSVAIMDFAKEYSNGSMNPFVDGNGAESCFGLSATINTERWIRLYRVPMFVKKALKSVYLDLGIWKKTNKISDKYCYLMKACEPDVQLSPFTLRIFPVEKSYDYKILDEEISDTMLETLSGSAFSTDSGNLAAKLTVADILHVCSRRFTFKTYDVGDYFNVNVVYPFLWKDILEEQGNIPFSIKFYNGILKWPLKKLLEDYVSYEFVYRKKSDFTPPFKLWLEDNDFYEFVREIVFRPNGVIIDLIPRNDLKKLFSLGHRDQFIPTRILGLLWAVFFTEMWIKENF